MPAKARRCPLEASDAKPHFGFVLMNGVYTRTITVTNRDPRSVRFTVIAPKTSCLPHYHENKLRLFTRDLVKLAPGMTISIDLLLFATTMARFTDGFEIRTAYGSLHVEVGAYILTHKDWTTVSRRLRLEKRPLIHPGVACLGTIERGRRKHRFANDLPEETRRLHEKHLKTTDRDHRPKRDRPIAACFPEEIEVSDLNGTVSMAPRTQLLEQLEGEELEELRVLPCVRSSYWDQRRQKLRLAPTLQAWSVNPDHTPGKQRAQAEAEEVAEDLRLERKGYISWRLLQLVRSGDFRPRPTEEEEAPAACCLESIAEEEEDERGAPLPPVARVGNGITGDEELRRRQAEPQKGGTRAKGLGEQAADYEEDGRRPSLVPVNDEVSLTILRGMPSGAYGALAQAMGSRGGSDIPSPSPLIGGANHAQAGVSRRTSFGAEFFDSPRFASHGNTTPLPANRSPQGVRAGMSLTHPNAALSHRSGEDDRLSDEWDGTKTGPWLIGSAARAAASSSSRF